MADSSAASPSAASRMAASTTVTPAITAAATASAAAASTTASATGPTTTSPASLPPAASAASAPPKRRSFLSRLAFPLRPPARTVADFHIQPAEPHRKYVAGDHVLGAVVVAVVKPLRITHLTVSLRGLVRVFKDPSAAAAAASAPFFSSVSGTTSGGASAMGFLTSSASSSISSSTSSSSSSSTAAPSSSSSSFLGNGHAVLFRDEIVLCGAGRLEPGRYEFGYDLIFPSEGLPSSIDFERGSIAYVVTATLTRPTTVAPTQSCERKVYLVHPVDVGTVSRPLPRTISLEPISKRSKRRKIVVAQQLPQLPQQYSALAASRVSQQQQQQQQHPTSTPPQSPRADALALSDLGSARGGSSHGGRLSAEAPWAPPVPSAASAASAASGASGASVAAPSSRSPAPTDVRSEISTESVASVTTSLSGGSGAGTATIQLANVSRRQSTGGRSAGTAAGPTGPAGATTTTAIVGSGLDERTITATIELLKGGCLPGDVVSVKVSVQHVKRIKSLHGVIVTLYRQGRIDSAPPVATFASVDEAAEGGGDDGDNDRQQQQQQQQQQIDAEAERPSQKKKEKKEKREKKEKEKKQQKQQKQQKRDQQKQQQQLDRAASHDYYYPKSKTGLGGLSLTSAGSCSVFRKDLSQSFSPLIIDPRTLQSSVTASVRVPEDAFATIKGVPGDMISFKYQLEVIVDLGGKLATLLQSGGSGGGGGGGHDGAVGGGGGIAPSDAAAAAAHISLPLWGASGSSTTSSSRHMVDTDQLRRQKGVIYVAFEVVVGTVDSGRQRRRGLSRAVAAAAEVADDEQIALQQQQQQQQEAQQTLSSQPPPFSSQPEGFWYPDDRKGSQSTAIATAGPSAGPSATAAATAAAGYPPYGPPHGVPDDLQHNYSFNNNNNNNNNNNSYIGHSAGPPPPPLLPPPPPSASAPQYVPTASMLASDAGLSEKDRLRRAEQRLLPSQPSDASTTETSHAGRAGPAVAGASAPPAAALGEDRYDYYSYEQPPDDNDDAGMTGPSAAPGPSVSSEDKQELERRRLLAEASAPPEFPEDYEFVRGEGGGRGGGDGAEAGGSSSSRSNRFPLPPPQGGPSAPVMDEADAGPGASGSAFAPMIPAAGVLGDVTAEAGDNMGVMSDEARYGRNYAYAYAYAPEAAEASAAASLGPAGPSRNGKQPEDEPLPRYER